MVMVANNEKHPALVENIDERVCWFYWSLGGGEKCSVSGVKRL
jgi:hypothetical protein